MITIEALRKPSKRFPFKQPIVKHNLDADIRVRISKKMREYLEFCRLEYGYSSMSRFCRDILITELDSFADEHGLD